MLTMACKIGEGLTVLLAKCFVFGFCSVLPWFCVGEVYCSRVWACT